MGISLGMVGQARYGVDLCLRIEYGRERSWVTTLQTILKDYYYKRLAVVDVRSYSRTPSNIRYDNLQASFADQNMRLFNTEPAYQQVFTILRDQMQIHQTTLAGRNAFLIGAPLRHAMSNK